MLTGVRGFLGSVLEQQALEAGWTVDGVDLDLYDGVSSATLQSNTIVTPSRRRSDFRDLRTRDLVGYDAVVHLAGISSDAACDLRVDPARRLNGAAAVGLARRARSAGVTRFVFASSCSVYGSAPGRISTERSACAPISAYARAKLAAEVGIRAEATSAFSPTVLRFATLYGLSPNLRSDLVVNAMATSARMRGEIMLHGTGRQSRPLLHVRDAAATILDLLKSSDDEVRGEIFNVTDGSPGYSIADLAGIIRRHVPASRVVHQPAATDRRHYRVDGTRLQRHCRRPSIRIEEGVEEVVSGLRDADWQRRASAPESNRARRLQHLLERGELGDDLRWRV